MSDFLSQEHPEESRDYLDWLAYQDYLDRSGDQDVYDRWYESDDSLFESDNPFYADDFDDYEQSDPWE